MLSWTLAALTIGLAVFDAVFTRRRVHKYGIIVEQNASLIKLSLLLGTITRAIVAMTVIPTVVIASLLAALEMPLFLAILLGMRLQLFKMQIDSLEMEKMIDKELAQRSISPPSSGAPSGPPEDP